MLGRCLFKFEFLQTCLWPTKWTSPCLQRSTTPTLWASASAPSAPEKSWWMRFMVKTIQFNAFSSNYYIDFVFFYQQNYAAEKFQLFLFCWWTPPFLFFFLNYNSISFWLFHFPYFFTSLIFTFLLIQLLLHFNVNLDCILGIKNLFLPILFGNCWLID